MNENLPKPVTAPGKSLFSQHYLDTRLDQHPEWDEDPAPVWVRIRALWLRAQTLGETWNESQTEVEFIKPALEALGWSFIVQVKSGGQKGRLDRPDYALFGSSAVRDAAYPHQGNDTALYAQALAVAEAKYWRRPLSQKGADGRDAWKKGSNPSYQMVSYLVGTRCPWGILSNGQVWRLYSREASSTASEFYEIDLGPIFAGAGDAPTPAQLAEFKRWWLFFRHAAFLPDAQGKSFVQRLAEGSATYARQISDKLKELVFEEVMPQIAGGFVAYRRQEMGIEAESEESLRQIYQASLSLLYKLLFVLYAEARALLPIHHPNYWEESLTRMAQQAAERFDRNLPPSDATHAAKQYDALLALFHRIDQGDPNLAVPRYDGGLFNRNAPDNQFLEQHKLSDRVVARAIDILVRDAGQPVDYAFISVRNLGAIYEGLLENKLQVIDAPAGPAATPRVALVNDKGERKATGSYYTPDYIVEYIVQHTLDPILDARAAGFATAMERCADLRRQLARSNITAGQVQFLRPQLDEAERRAREAFLGIKVCDPAMGSGHFLVNAVDHLTDGIIQRLQGYHDAHPETPWEWNPIQNLIERVRREIMQEMERQGIAVDPARLDDTALLTRLVMKRCIYGVDLNPMAVELAKLSLWLHSFTVGAPLSFLDHHLRWGNSLIGSDVRTVEAAIQQAEGGQMALWGGPFAGLVDLTGVMTEIAGRADATLADVRQSATEFAAMQRALTPYKQALDLWVSQYFGNKAAAEFLTLYGDDVLPALRGERSVGEPYAGAIEQARALWRQKRFFHWDLEFPEVFVDMERRDWAENPGFDAVIGNPPYVFITAIPANDRRFYFSAFPICDYRFDLYGLFIDVGIELSHSMGVLGYIIPHSLLNNNSFERLRVKLVSSCQEVRLIDFTEQVFADAANEPMILLARKKSGTEPTVLKGALIPKRQLRTADQVLSTFSSTVVEKLPGHPFLVRGGYWIQRLLENPRCKPLSSTVFVTQGLRTGDNDRFLTTKPGTGHRKILAGADIGRYKYDWQGVFVRYDRTMLDAPRDEMYWSASERLIIQEIRNVYLERRIIACYDKDDHIGLNTTNVMIAQPDAKLSLKYVLSILLSRLVNEFFRMCFVDNHIATQYLLSVPLRTIAVSTSAAERARLAEKGRRLYDQFCAKEDFACVLGFVDHHLSADPERSDVVHDLLAFLAEQMIEMNKQKQAEVKGFLAWLEREIGAKVDDLTGKTTLQNYLGDYQKGQPPASLDTLLAVLKKNSRKLAADPGKRAFQEALQHEYEASLGKLLPIKARLAATDRLIDPDRLPAVWADGRRNRGGGNEINEECAQCQRKTAAMLEILR